MSNRTFNKKRKGADAEDDVSVLSSVMVEESESADAPTVVVPPDNSKLLLSRRSFMLN